MPSKRMVDKKELRMPSPRLMFHRMLQQVAAYQRKLVAKQVSYNCNLYAVNPRITPTPWNTPPSKHVTVPIYESVSTL